MGYKHWRYAHCVLYFKDSGSWFRYDLTWQGIQEHQFNMYEDEDTIVEEEDWLCACPVPLTFGVYKRLGWLKALALMSSERIRFSPLACVTMLLGKTYPWFNCASFVSFVLFAEFVDTPSELFELIEEQA